MSTKLIQAEALDVIGALVSVIVTREDWERGGTALVAAKCANASATLQRVLEDDAKSKGWRDRE